MDGLLVRIDNKAEIQDEVRGKRKRKEDRRTVGYETACANWKLNSPIVAYMAALITPENQI